MGDLLSLLRNSGELRGFQGHPFPLGYSGYRPLSTGEFANRIACVGMTWTIVISPTESNAGIQAATSPGCPHPSDICDLSGHDGSGFGVCWRLLLISATRYTNLAKGLGLSLALTDNLRKGFA
jgi:hypothetical protein